MSVLYRWLVGLGKACAALGALVALATGLLTTVSVASRALWSRPIPGDVEITQMAIALAISLCIPYCQIRRANIVVDFFTQSMRVASVRALDALGQWTLALIYALLAWRTLVGAVSVGQAGETTMIMALPMWWAYACLAPGLALACLIAVMQALGYAEEGLSS